MTSCRLLAVQLWGLWGVGLTMPGEVGREAKERGRRAGQVKLCETMMGPVSSQQVPASLHSPSQNITQLTFTSKL